MQNIPFEITLIGMGTGALAQLSFEAAQALQQMDVVLLPKKGEEKTELLKIRETLCAQVLQNEEYFQKNPPVLAYFDYPIRHSKESDPRAHYENAVQNWHKRIAVQWQMAIVQALENQPHLKTILNNRVLQIGLLVWGDASLYDSTLRIARHLRPAARAVRSVAGISTPAALAAAHALQLCDVGASLLVTTGRNLREHGWPFLATELRGVDWQDAHFRPAIASVCVMLDAQASFQTLPQAVAARLQIWWGAFLGMPQQRLCAGPLLEVAPQIVAEREAARASMGWVMDAYLLRWHV